MKALVTGTGGFIGSHLTERLLRDGHEVTGIDSFSDYYARSLKEYNLRSAREHSSVRFVEGDLNELDLVALLRDVDVVFHLAARAGVRTSWGSEFDFYLRDNVLGTQKLLQAARESRIRRLVYASSSSLYGDAERYPTPESATPAPISPYGVSKLAGEHLCRLYWRHDGLPAVSLRLFTVYGPRQRPDMAFHIFGRALLEGRPIEVFGDGGQSREFTYVDDVVEAFLSAAERGEPGGAYNVSGGSETTLIDAVHLMMRLTGREVPIVHHASMAGDARRTAADLTLARQDLGYAPKVWLDEGLRAELVWLEELGSREAAGFSPQTPR